MGKLKKGVLPPHSRGGVDAGGSETAVATASTSKEATETDTVD